MSEQTRTEPSPEEIDAKVERLLGELSDHTELFVSGSPEFQEEWYWIEMEANVAKDRPAAIAKLEEFIGKLKEMKPF